MHHLEDGVSMAKIHVGDASASGSVARHTFIAWHNHIAVKVGLRFLLLFPQRLLLLHGELGRHFFFQRRQLLRKVFENILDITVQHLLVGFRNVVAILLADGNQILIENGNGHLGLGLLLDKTDYARAFTGGLKIIGVKIVVITYTLTGIAANEKNIADMLFLSCQRHFIESLQFLLGEINLDSLVAVFNLLLDNECCRTLVIVYAVNECRVDKSLQICQMLVDNLCHVTVLLQIVDVARHKRTVNIRPPELVLSER